MSAAGTREAWQAKCECNTEDQKTERERYIYIYVRGSFGVYLATTQLIHLILLVLLLERRINWIELLSNKLIHLILLIPRPNPELNELNELNPASWRPATPRPFTELNEWIELIELNE